jgi:hypothetical protein
MTGDRHVRFRENAGVKLPCVTRLAARQSACPHSTWTSDARARVLQPIPATVPSYSKT